MTAMSTPLRILLIEDSQDDAVLLVRELTRAGFAPVFKRVETAADLEVALDGSPWDVIVGDNSMPRFSGTEALRLVRSKGIDVPFIFVSGTMGEDLAVSALEAGAGDALSKGDLRRLVPVIRRELRDAGERRARRAAQTALTVS